MSKTENANTGNGTMTTISPNTNIDIRPGKSGWTFAARDAYCIKDELKARGYRFNGATKNWELTLDNETTIIDENTWVVGRGIPMSYRGKPVAADKITTRAA